MNLTTIEDGIYDWADAQTTLPVMWADQDAPMPSGSYITLRINNSTRIGEDYVSIPSPTTNLVSVIGNRELVVEVQGYGAGVSQVIEDMRTSLSKITVQDFFRSKSLVCVDSTPVLNLAVVVDSQIEERRMFEITLRTTEEVTDDVGFITTVRGTGTVKDPSGNTAVIKTYAVVKP